MSVHDIPGREIAERLAFIQQHPDDPGAVPGGDRRGPSHLPAPAAQIRQRVGLGDHGKRH